MAQALCVPVYCDCGERLLWRADLQWLEQEGLKMSGPVSLTSHRQPPPRGAVDVTGVFNARCPRCFNVLPVFPLMRTRLAAGAGLLIDSPADDKDAGRSTRKPVAQPADRSARLANREGRRARRARPETNLHALATTSFAVTIADISSVGLCAEHTHQTQVGDVYTLNLNLPPSGTLQVAARVAWTRSWRIDRNFGEQCATYRTGFEFVGIGPQAAAAIEAYVVRISKQTEAGTPRPR